jgi:hypothetical protein
LPDRQRATVQCEQNLDIPGSEAPFHRIR